MAKVTFNGPQLLIELLPGVTSIDVQGEIYGDWKEWALTNPQYPQAMRSTGGDPLPGGKAIGRYFFLLNGWKLLPASPTTTDVEINGNLFTEDGSNLFVTESGIQLIRQVVSQLSDISFVSGSGGGGLTSGQATQLTNIEQKVTITSSSVQVVSGSVSTVQSGVNTLLSSQSLQQTDLNELLQYSVEASASLAILQNAGGSLTPTQATMLLEMYRLLGLDPARPLIVTPSTRQAGPEISQSIGLAGSDVTVTRI
jgi:hypothetical protein